jgi:hypothetical protein
MHRFTRLLLAMVLVSAAGSARGVGEPLPTAEALQQEVVEHRRGWKTGVVELTLNILKSESQPVDENIRRDFRLWVDGIKQRNEVHWHKSSGKTDIYHLVYDGKTAITNSHPEMPICVDKSGGKLPKDTDLISPTVLGITPVEFVRLRQRTVGDFEASIAKNNGGRVERVQLGGVDVFKVEFTATIQGIRGRRTLWIDRARGPSLVRIELVQGPENDPTKETYSVVQEIEVMKVEGGWYPRSVHTTQNRDGKLVDEERVTVKSAEFGKPLPVNTFTLEGLGLPAGQELLFDSKTIKKWDGKKVGDATVVDNAVSHSVVGAGIDWWVPVVAAVGAVLGTVGVLFLVRVFSARRK